MKKQTFFQKDEKISMRPPLVWREKAMMTSCTHVPEESGVYAIGLVERCRGLEVSREYLYIGETKNLRQRLEQHGPLKEPKPGFRNYLQKHMHFIKCWYCRVPQNKKKEEQDFLIRKFRPRFNVQHNTGRTQS